jgi:hypothetical protein
MGGRVSEFPFASWSAFPFPSASPSEIGEDHDGVTHARDGTGSQTLPPKSTVQLIRLFRLAQLCTHNRLLDTMISLLRQLMADSVQYAYLAMTLADELDIRQLRGAAYFEVMRKGRIVRGGWRIDGTGVRMGGATAAITAVATGTGVGAGAGAAAILPPAGVLRPPPVRPLHPLPGRPLGPPPIIGAWNATTNAGPSSFIGPSSTSSTSTAAAATAVVRDAEEEENSKLVITPSQQLRLLLGYYRLTHLWDKIRTQPPNFVHQPSCWAGW